MDIHEVRNTSCDLGYSDELLHEIGRMLPGQWKKLGIYLDIAYERLEKMVKVKTTQEMAMEMFRGWWSRTSPHSRWGELHHAYATIHRQDLIQKSQQFWKDNNIDYNNPDQCTMDRYFYTMSECLPKEWKDMGVQLDIPLDMLSTIGQQPEQDMSLHCFRVLKMWQISPKSSHHQLIRVMMDDMRRHDITRFMLNYFSTHDSSYKGAEINVTVSE